MTPSFVGIVGHAADKFTPESEAVAREVIRFLLADKTAILVSGHCPFGGIDIWAEEEAAELGRRMCIFPPETRSWETGFKPRNLRIASVADIVHCIVVSDYPPGYSSRRFLACYHCHTSDHVKSGGCWTARRAKAAEWWVLQTVEPIPF